MVKRPLVYVWLYRRHASYPNLNPGTNYVAEDVAQTLIADGCAQDQATDSRRLKHISTEPPFKRVAKPPVNPPKTGSPLDELAPIKKKRTYKRRDMTSESNNV